MERDLSLYLSYLLYNIYNIYNKCGLKPCGSAGFCVVMPVIVQCSNCITYYRSTTLT